MSASPDSRQIEQLRYKFHYAQAEAAVTRTATPLRLGQFASERGIVITDFGTHSKRWRRLFIQGARSGPA